MKKVILTCGLIAMLMIAGAQERKVSTTRERYAALVEIKDNKALKSSLAKLIKSKAEDDQMLAYIYYSRNNQDEKANELKQSMIKAFPKGQFASDLKIEEIRVIKDLDEKAAQFQKLLKENPNANVGFEMHTMAMLYADRGDVAKMKEYTALYRNYARDRNGNPIPEKESLASMAMYLVPKNPQAAIPLLADGLDVLRGSLNQPEEGETDEIRKQRRSRAEQNYYSMMSSYIEALLQTDKKSEGLQLVSALLKELKDKREGRILQRIYVDALLANQRFGEAFPYAEEGFKKSTMREANEELLRKGYEATKGSLDGFDDYMMALRTAKVNYEKEQLLKKVVSKEAPDFELKDVDGKTVRLADLKGKVVVLDFWATWCGPCKASFPMMQKAVNKYKEDPNVKFLFIHTWEKGSGDPTVNAKKYVTDNHYTFDVLMDLRDTETKVSAVAKAYQVDGIPAKFIIDTHGRIRFDSGGSAIDEDKAMEELSAMIEFAKKG